MSLKVKEYHECPKPSMLLGEKEVTWTTGKFWWKKTRTKTVQRWQTKEAHYTCEVCKSQYIWIPQRKEEFEGWWRADKRTYTWKKV